PDGTLTTCHLIHALARGHGGSDTMSIGGYAMRDALDRTIFDLGERDAAAAALDVLRRQGVAILSGIRDRPGLRRAGRTLLDIRTHRDNDPDGVTVIEQRIAFAATRSLAGFTDQELLPHTDGSAVSEPPRMLMLA